LSRDALFEFIVIYVLQELENTCTVQAIFEKRQVIFFYFVLLFKNSRSHHCVLGSGFLEYTEGNLLCGLGLVRIGRQSLVTSNPYAESVRIRQPFVLLQCAD
jgi:hypothetical protein